MKCPAYHSDSEYCLRYDTSLLESFWSNITAKLIVDESAEDAETSFLLNKENCIIGRRDPYKGMFPDVDLTPFDPGTQVSRFHARIYRKGNQFFLEDLESFNGTYIIEGERESRISPKEPRPLQDGIRIRLANVLASFELSENQT